MPREHLFARSFLTTAVVTALLTGCGSSDDSDDSKADPDKTSSGKWQAAVASPSLTPGDGAPVYWDLETNSIVTENDDWEIKIAKSGYSTVYSLNGGASGKGQAAIAGADRDGKALGVGALMVDSVWDVTNPTDTDQVYKYFTDSAEGAFKSPGDYGALEYGAHGGHAMSPTFAVYLVEDGDGNTHKVQILSNTGETGTLSSGSLFIRYAEATADAAIETISLDATSAKAGLDISGDLAIADTAANTNWDLAYQKYVGFSLNDTAKGCVAFKYDALYDAEGNPVSDEFKKLTATSTQADFNAVKSGDCTTAADTVKTLMPTSGWYDYDMSTHQVSVHDKGDSNGWIIQSADGKSYARVHFSAYSPLTLQVEKWQVAEE